MRVWVLKPEQSINAASSLDLIGDISTPSILQEITPLHCADVSGGSENAATVCEHMITDAEGEKIGGLVRSPLIIKEGMRSTVVSICLVPQKSSGYESIHFCL